MKAQEKLDIALQYIALGLKIQPIHWVSKNKICSCGNTKCKSAGKHPLTEHGYLDGSNNEDVVRGWLSKWPKCNIGLTMGQKTGECINGSPVKLIALDIDPRNGGDDGLQQLIGKHGPLPDTALQLTQSGGEHYLFYAPEECYFPNLLADGVEVKTKNHINVYPSVGPVGAYEWEASSDLLEGAPILQAPDWILKYSETKERENKGKVDNTGYIDPAKFADIKEALPFIQSDNYDDWIRVGQALKTLGQQGFGIWVSWSQLSSKYDAKVMRPKWESFSPNQINVESIFHLAESNGWVNSAKQGQESLDELVKKADSTPRIVTKEQKPVANLEFNNSLDSVSELIQAGGNIRNINIGRAAALSLVSFFAGRRYITEFGDPVHLHMTMISPSLSEIRYIKDSIFSASCSVSLNKSFRATRITSVASLYSLLYKSPNLMYVADDYGMQVAFSKRQPAGLLEQSLNSLSDCFASKHIPLENPMEYQIKDAPRDGCVIENPCITLLAMVSDEQVTQLVTSGEVGRGSIDQFLYVYSDPELSQLSEPTPIEWPQWLIEHVKRIRNTGPAMDHTQLMPDNSEQSPDLKQVNFSVKPGEYYEKLLALSDNKLARNILISSRVSFRRVASLLAIWRNPETPVVTADDLDYAFNYVNESNQLIIDRLKLLSSDDGKLTTQQRVMQIISKAGPNGITITKLRDSCRAFKKLNGNDRINLVDQMKEDGDLVEMPTKNRKGKLLISTEFAELKHQYDEITETNGTNGTQTGHLFCEVSRLETQEDSGLEGQTGQTVTPIYLN